MRQGTRFEGERNWGGKGDGGMGCWRQRRTTTSTKSGLESCGFTLTWKDFDKEEDLENIYCTSDLGRAKDLRNEKATA